MTLRPRADTRRERASHALTHTLLPSYPCVSHLTSLIERYHPRKYSSDAVYPQKEIERAVWVYMFMVSHTHILNPSYFLIKDRAAAASRFPEIESQEGE